METEELLSMSSGNELRSRQRPPVWLLGVMWSLGALGRHSSISNTQDISVTSRAKHILLPLTTVTVSGILAVSSALSAILYLICFFGRSDHFLRLFSFLCYWFTMMTPQITCAVACLMNFKRNVRNTNRGHIRWFHVFDGTSFLEDLRDQNYHRIKFRMLLVFMTFAFSVIVAKGVYFYEMDKGCRDWIEYIWLFCDIFNVLYFASFCYFLYLRRFTLEAKAISTSDYITRNIGNLDNCIHKSREFFRDYQQLRTVILPWLRIALFSSSFGLAVFVTWNYDDAFNQDSNMTTTAPLFKSQFFSLQSICNYTCDQESYMKQSRVFFPFNVLMFCRNMMIAASTLIIVRGLDVLYVWEKFKTRVFFSYTAEERKFWKYLLSFLDSLHPHSKADTFVSFLIPLLGTATGMLGGKHF